MGKSETNMMDPTVLIDLVNTDMPFGKYKGTAIYLLPEHYIVWFHENGFPEGRLGMLLSTIYEIKVYGLEHLLDPIIRRNNSLLN